MMENGEEEEEGTYTEYSNMCSLGPQNSLIRPWEEVVLPSNVRGSTAVFDARTLICYVRSDVIVH